MQRAKRAQTLVTVLHALAAAYDISISVSRESSDEAVLKAFRLMSLRVRPDKGGSTSDMQRLASAKDSFEHVRADSLDFKNQRKVVLLRDVKKLRR